MVLNKEIVLIHGTWCDGNVWGEFATGLRQMGYKVHTPSFRYHDLPYQECLAKVGTVTLQDYRDDLVALIESLDQPPLILGHSLGCQEKSILRWLFIGLIRQKQLTLTLVRFHVLFSSFLEPRIR